MSRAPTEPTSGQPRGPEGLRDGDGQPEPPSDGCPAGEPPTPSPPAEAKAADEPASAAPEPQSADEPAPAAQPSRARRWRRLITITAVVVLGGLVALGYQAWLGTQRVELDDASIRAPQVNLPARGGGALKQAYASVGDEVRAHYPIARVGNEVITADVDGTIVSIRDDLGSAIAPGAVVASLIDRDDLRAVGLVDEDAGLSDLRLGQRASVEVDAFEGRTFSGFVEEISRRPHTPPVSFNIADRDEEQQYEVKVRFDGDVDPELRQGLSASVEVRK